MLVLYQVECFSTVAAGTHPKPSNQFQVSAVLDQQAELKCCFLSQINLYFVFDGDVNQPAASGASDDNSTGHSQDDPLLMEHVAFSVHLPDANLSVGQHTFFSWACRIRHYSQLHILCWSQLSQKFSSMHLVWVCIQILSAYYILQTGVSDWISFPGNFLGLTDAQIELALAAALDRNVTNLCLTMQAGGPVMIKNIICKSCKEPEVRYNGQHLCLTMLGGQSLKIEHRLEKTMSFRWGILIIHGDPFWEEFVLWSRRGRDRKLNCRAAGLEKVQCSLCGPISFSCCFCPSIFLATSRLGRLGRGTPKTHSMRVKKWVISLLTTWWLGPQTVVSCEKRKISGEMWCSYQFLLGALFVQPGVFYQLIK